MIEVVGAAILRDGRVLAALRGPNMSHPDVWEFPGGKIEPGESPAQALVREIEEELCASIAVGQAIHTVERGTIRLTIFAATLLGAGITPTEHIEVRWLGVDELGTVVWGPADLDALPAVRALLG